jgi:hypothetical protein
VVSTPPDHQIKFAYLDDSLDAANIPQSPCPRWRPKTGLCGGQEHLKTMSSIDWIDAEKNRAAVDLNLTAEEWKAL